MRGSNAALAEQVAGSDWDIPALQATQRARIEDKHAEWRTVSPVSTELFGSQHSYNVEGFVSIFAPNEAKKFPFGDSLTEGYMHISTHFPNQEADQLKLERGLLIERLQKDYVFENRARVCSYLENRPSLPQILLEAIPHLKECFGATPTPQLQLPFEDETPQTIYGIVPWMGSVSEARAALRRFDDSWWRDGSKKASGRIVFDYKLA